MQYYRCKCGKLEAYGSMGPDPCRGCDECGTNLTTHPDFHHPPVPHRYEAQPVETDEGVKMLTQCTWCGKHKPPTTSEDS
jgi:hypothetical protein